MEWHLDDVSCDFISSHIYMVDYQMGNKNANFLFAVITNNSTSRFYYNHYYYYHYYYY